MTIPVDLGGPWKNPGVEDEAGLTGTVLWTRAFCKGQPNHGQVLLPFAKEFSENLRVAGSTCEGGCIPPLDPRVKIPLLCLFLVPKGAG